MKDKGSAHLEFQIKMCEKYLGNGRDLYVALWQCRKHITDWNTMYVVDTAVLAVAAGTDCHTPSLTTKFT